MVLIAAFGDSQTIHLIVKPVGSNADNRGKAAASVFAAGCSSVLRARSGRHVPIARGVPTRLSLDRVRPQTTGRPLIAYRYSPDFTLTPGPLKGARSCGFQLSPVYTCWKR